jgi:adenylylsulfate kinase
MKNIVYHTMRVSRSDREQLNGHRGACLWFTGLSGSGKSTLANEVEAILNQKGIHSYLLDGDNIRHGLNSNLDFSDEGRKENIRRISEVAKLFVDAGIIVLTAFISPFRTDRDSARKIINTLSSTSSSSSTLSSTPSFIEIFVDADLETCESRDPKGLYKKARAGEITDFTGISSPYEAPLNPEIYVDNGKGSNLQENAAQIIAYLQKFKLIHF